MSSNVKISTELGRLRSRAQTLEMQEVLGLCERLALRVELLERADRRYRCGVCGTSDPQGYQRCSRGDCPDGRDR